MAKRKVKAGRKEEAERAPGPWRIVANSWRYTTIYDSNNRIVCQLDLEDWGVTEDNQAALEAEQERVANLIAAAPDLFAFCEAFLATPPKERHNIDLELWAEAAIVMANGGD